jgi:hypothetical protein
MVKMWHEQRLGINELRGLRALFVAAENSLRVSQRISVITLNGMHAGSVPKSRRA